MRSACVGKFLAVFVLVRFHFFRRGFLHSAIASVEMTTMDALSHNVISTEVRGFYPNAAEKSPTGKVFFPYTQRPSSLPGDCHGGEPPRASGLTRVRKRRFVSTRLPRRYAPRNDKAIYRSAWIGGGTRTPRPFYRRVSTGIADLPAGAPCRRDEGVPPYRNGIRHSKRILAIGGSPRADKEHPTRSTEGKYGHRRLARRGSLPVASRHGQVG